MNIQTIYRLSGARFRRKRMRDFIRMFEITRQDRILDVGGTLFNWSLIDFCPHLTIVNLSPPPAQLPEKVEWIVADARSLQFPDNHFDVVYSNSLIEHFFTWEDQRQLAWEIQRLAPKYYVQTPSRSFPVEPHYLTPFIHWFPVSLRKKIVRNFTLQGWITRPSQEECERMAQGIRLLDEKDMRALFPRAMILRERFVGMTKSIIAVKGTSIQIELEKGCIR